MQSLKDELINIDPKYVLKNKMRKNKRSKSRYVIIVSFIFILLSMILLVVKYMSTIKEMNTAIRNINVKLEDTMSQLNILRKSVDAFNIELSKRDEDSQIDHLGPLFDH
jgi:cell division protein FtsL